MCRSLERSDLKRPEPVHSLCSTACGLKAASAPPRGCRRAGLANGTSAEGRCGLGVRCSRELTGCVRAKREVGGSTVLLFLQLSPSPFWLLLPILFCAACGVSKCVFPQLEKRVKPSALKIIWSSSFDLNFWCLEKGLVFSPLWLI